MSKPPESALAEQVARAEECSARIDALNDRERRELLAWLCGYCPETIDLALAALERSSNAAVRSLGGQP